MLDGGLHGRRPDRAGRRREQQRDGGQHDGWREHANAPPGQRAAADGHLDEEVGGDRDRKRDGDAHDGELPAVEARARLVEPHEHRPVPEVEAVADEADPAQRRERQRDGDRPARRMCGCGQHDHAATPAASSPPWSRNASWPSRKIHSQASHATAARPATSSATRVIFELCPPERHGGGEPGAEQDRRCARVGAEVRAAVVCARRAERDRERTEANRPDDCNDEHARGKRESAQRQHDEPKQEERPHQVELLLDRQAPGVVERRWRTEDRTVVVTVEDLAPVRDVPNRRKCVAADLVELAGLGDERRKRRNAGEHEEQRGQQTPRPASPERRELDRAGLLALGQQEAGDQETRENEEEVDAEVPAGQVPSVKEDDRDDGSATRAVERRDMAQRRSAATV